MGAVGIPGSVGGAVVMNAGAHSSCVADMLVNTQVLSPLEWKPSLPTTGLQLPQINLAKSQHVVTQAFKLQPGSDPQQV